MVIPDDDPDSPYERFFPYDEPYDHQREAIEGIAEALEDASDVLLEGATGTGKTLAALTPALEHARRTDKTVVITTNVHQQMRQFTAEARAINHQESIRAIVFRGKASMCHIDVGYEECQALRDTTHDLVDAESERADLERRQRDLLEESQAGDGDAAEARSAIMDELESVGEELQTLREEQSTCEHYYHNLTSDTDDFYAWLYDDVRTPDEVYEYAERQGFCGYELLKDGIEGVDLVICNYHHLLDPFVREQFFRWLGRDPSDVIAVFDEAHNVADAARDHARRTLAEPTLERALDELDGSDDPRADAARNVLTTIHTALQETYEDALAFGQRETIEDDWEDLAIDNDDRRDDLTLSLLQHYTGQGVSDDLASALKLGQALDQQYEDAFKDGETSVRKECPTLQAATFFEAWLAESDESGLYPVVSVRRDDDNGDLYGRAELYTAIPQRVTSGLFEDLYATVLMSATLRPFDVTEDVLGLEDPVTMAYGPQFPAERRRTYAVDVPALFASRRDEPELQDTVAGVIEDAARMTPGNTLAFFPSYAEAERYHDRVNIEGTRYLDEPGTRAQELRETFTADDDGVLFTSLWGTLAEGVSFDGDDARTVLVVGVPYPYLDERMDAVQAAYETAFDGEDAGWRYAVEIPTVRKTRQAMGRVIRSPEDFGARVLIDRRYTEDAEIQMPEYAVRGTFPPAERSEMIDVDPGKLKFGLLNFYADVEAYDGDPPAP
ncbi:ATP-dependent DNA helicase [Halorhabdus sp. CBA1104]|uniref:ATP-dependent DNA helicase n=1 Tax=Halorhabdus sp. CBA1104 TaxID=1380432 RepID=UPI001E2B8C0B|nr:ATP-dependent DNA helicase [Halorhabdus sp. CBA1104]